VRKRSVLSLDSSFAKGFKLSQACNNLVPTRNALGSQSYQSLTKSPGFAEGSNKGPLKLDRFPFATTRQKHLDDPALRFAFSSLTAPVRDAKPSQAQQVGMSRFPNPNVWRVAGHLTISKPTHWVLEGRLSLDAVSVTAT
jgi:hypothetical protein